MPISKREILDDECMRVTLTDGDSIILEYQDSMTRVIIKSNGTQCGEIGFEVREHERAPGHDVSVARLVYAFNEQFAGHGVGTEAVKWFLFQHGVDPQALEFPEYDGHRRENGEHLTGNGPAFVNSLKLKQRSGRLRDDYDNI